MKKLIFLFGLFLSINSFSQNYLQKGDTIIKLSGYDLINNNIRYDRITPTDTVGIIKYIPDLWEFTTETINLFDAAKTIWRKNNDAIIDLIHVGYFMDYAIKSE